MFLEVVLLSRCSSVVGARVQRIGGRPILTDLRILVELIEQPLYPLGIFVDSNVGVVAVVIRRASCHLAHAPLSLQRAQTY